MKTIYYCIAAILISSCCGNAREPKESDSATIQQKQHDSIRDTEEESTVLTHIDVIRIDDPRYTTPIVWEEWEKLPKEKKEGLQPVYRSAHKSATFNGGPEALGRHLLKHVQPEYRFDIKKHNPRYDNVSQGISFIVECDGSISNVSPIDYTSRRELTENEKDALLKETTRVLCDSTSFFPAEINGEPCRMVILAYILYPISGEHSARYDILRYDVKVE